VAHSVQRTPTSAAIAPELVALRIDHISSAAVAELAAKPIVDIQISVASLDPVLGFCGLCRPADSLLGGQPGVDEAFLPGAAGRPASASTRTTKDRLFAAV
jgi:GrpB protein